jgi:hypothetical protein
MRSQGTHRSPILAAIAALLLVGCSDAVAPGSQASSPAPLLLPEAALPTMAMTSEDRSIDLDELASESSHPDELRSVLEGSGYTGGAERTFGGGKGTFARVLARGLAFSSDEGAAAYLTWLRELGPSELVGGTRIEPAGLPDGVIAIRHLPDGCCHNDVPVFLAAWQRGSSVLYLSASGREATARGLVDLVHAYDAEG